MEGKESFLEGDINWVNMNEVVGLDWKLVMEWHYIVNKHMNCTPKVTSMHMRLVFYAYGFRKYRIYSFMTQ